LTNLSRFIIKIDYIEAFFRNINWKVVEGRLK
jgi:superoxide dismutase